jgi:hypothetical protein
VLDTRFGYTPEEVAATFAAWTPAGRLRYLLIEAIDVVVYCTAYRGASIVLINRCALDMDTAPGVIDWVGWVWVSISTTLRLVGSCSTMTF